MAKRLQPETRFADQQQFTSRLRGGCAWPIGLHLGQAFQTRCKISRR